MGFTSNVLILALALMINYSLFSQEMKIIEIREAGGSKKNQQIYLPFAVAKCHSSTVEGRFLPIIQRWVEAVGV